jgi:hypothetical protein
MRTRILLALPLLAACGALDSRDQSAIETGGTPLIAREVIARRIAAIGNDSFPLVRPLRIRLLGDTLVVSDVHDDRIALFDARLELLHRFGRSGAGPGEFQAPLGLLSWNGLIVVGDLTNQRVSFFRPDGELVREVPLRESLRSFAVGPDGSVYHVAHASPDAYFTVITPDDDRHPWGPRPPVLELEGSGAAGRESWRDEFLVVRTADNAFHVFDSREGVLFRLDQAGEVRRTVRLPDRLLDPIRRRQREAVEAFARQGTRVLHTPLVKDFTTTADGQLLLALSSGDVVAVLIDPATYALREVRVPPETGPWQAAHRASSMTVRDNVLYFVTDDGIHAFALEDAPRG